MKKWWNALFGALGRLKLKELGLYLGLFAFVFMSVFYLTFPIETIKSTLLTELEARTGAKVTIDQLKPLRLSGLSARGLKLFKPSDPANAVAEFDLLRFRLRLGPLLRARQVVDFDLEGYGGGLSGVLEARSKQRVALAINFLNLDLNRYNFAKLVEDFGELKLFGKLSGFMNLYFDAQNRRNSKGALDIKLAELRIADATILEKSLPNIVFEPAAVKMDFNRNAFTISEWTMNGDNLSVNMTGRLTINDTNMMKSRMSFTLKAKPSDAVMDQFPELAMMKEPDAAGWYTVRLNGPLDNISPKMR